MKTNGVRTAKFSHHVMMAAIGMTKASARRKKEKDPLDGELIAKEVLSWRPKFSVKNFAADPSSVGWKLRNPRVRELFSQCKRMVYFDAPE